MPDNIRARSCDRSETHDLDHLLTLPVVRFTQELREDTMWERQARLHFAVFVDTRIEKNILDGSVAEFKAKMDSFVYELKWHMMKFSNSEPQDKVVMDA